MKWAITTLAYKSSPSLQFPKNKNKNHKKPIKQYIISPFLYLFLAFYGPFYLHILLFDVFIRNSFQWKTFLFIFSSNNISIFNNLFKIMTIEVELNNYLIG